MSYEVNFTIRKGTYSDRTWEDHPHTLMTREGLISLLSHPHRFIVNSATYVIAESFLEYRSPDRYENLTDDHILQQVLFG